MHDVEKGQRIQALYDEYQELIANIVKTKNELLARKFLDMEYIEQGYYIK